MAWEERVRSGEKAPGGGGSPRSGGLFKEKGWSEEGAIPLEGGPLFQGKGGRPLMEVPWSFPRQSRGKKKFRVPPVEIPPKKGGSFPRDFQKGLYWELREDSRSSTEFRFGGDGKKGVLWQGGGEITFFCPPSKGGSRKRLVI